MSVPNVPLVCTLVALDRRRWRRITLFMAVGSALAAATFAYVLENWGRGQIAVHFSRLVGSPHWALVADWVFEWGLPALVMVAGSPIAQTPAIVAVSLLGMPTSEVFAAVLAGKLIKYAVVAYLTQRTMGDVEAFSATGGK